MPDSTDHANAAYWQSLAQYEDDQREIIRAQIRTPSANDVIERRAALRDSGMDADQIDSVIRREQKAARSEGLAEEVERRRGLYPI